jgi:thioredoxin-related protein
MTRPPVRRTPALAALAVALLAAALPAAAAPEPGAAVWRTELEPALAEARRSGRPLLVDLYAEWCTWCHRLDREVFSTPRFAELARDFVLLRVDVEDEGEGTWLMERLGASSLPTLAILDADLVRLGEVRGYFPMTLFLQKIERALVAYETMLQRDEERARGDDPVVLAQVARELASRFDGARAAAVLERLLARDGLAAGERVELLVSLAEARRLARRFDEAATTLAAARRTLGEVPEAPSRLQDSVDVAVLRLAHDRADCGAVATLETFLRERAKSRWVGRARSDLAELKASPALDCS